MTISETLVKDLEGALAAVSQKLAQEFSQIRGNRPSADLLQDIRVNVYDQSLTIRELGSLSMLPPRTIQITVWDAAALPAVMKAIDAAHLGLSTTNDGSTIRATLSSLGNERREELMKFVGKTSEAARIQVRARRDEVMKRLKDAEAMNAATEDDVFRTKEKIQKAVERTNAGIEALTAAKLGELGE